MQKFLLLLLSVFISLGISAKDNWEFSNSTPQEAVKSHFYFLNRAHYDPTLASYTLADYTATQKQKQASIIKLKEILRSMNLDIDKVLDRKKGIVQKDKFQLFSYEPRIYLERVSRKWVYSVKTINSIPELYSKYVLKIKNEAPSETKQQEQLINDIISSDSSLTGFSLATPYNTIMSHLMYLSDSLFNPELAAHTINFAIEDTANAVQYAIMLKQIFQGSGNQIFFFNKLSKDTNFIDTASGKAIYYPNAIYPELFLEKIGDNWLYSRSTSKLIHSVHLDRYGDNADDVFKFSDRFKRLAGVNNSNNIGIFKYWQLLMLLFFFGAIFLLYLFNKIVIRRIINKILRHSPFRINTYQLFSTVSFLILLYVIENYAPAVELSVEYNFILIKGIKLFIIFFFTLLAMYFVNWLKIFFTIGHTHDSQFGIVIFTSMIVKSLIFIASLMFVIDLFEFNLVNFLAGLSIGGFALAFGAQDTIKNFLGSLMIFADKSFRVGDWIDNGDVSGTVEEIGLRSTKVRTFHNSLVTVPNSLLSDNNIDNLGRRIYRRYKSAIVVKYDTPSDLIDLFTKKITELIEEHPKTRKDFYMVHINDFSSYGVKVLIYTFFEVSDWKMEMQARHELIKSILDVRDELGIEFSIPLIAKTD